MKNKKQAVIFDLDGTLIDSLGLHYQSYTEVLKDLNIKLTKEQFRNFNGLTGKEILKKILPPKTKDQLIEQIYKEKHQVTVDHLDRVVLMKHAKEILIWCKVNKILVALATSSNKDFVNKIFKFHKITKYFDTILSWEDITKPKPDPEIFESAARALGMKMSQALVVEDSEMGIISAKKAKITAVALIGTNNKKQLESMRFKPDYIINDLLVIKDFLINLT